MHGAKELVTVPHEIAASARGATSNMDANVMQTRMLTTARAIVRFSFPCATTHSHSSQLNDSSTTTWLPLYRMNEYERVSVRVCAGSSWN